METIFVNAENNKTNEPHKSVLNWSQRLGLRSSNKHVALQNLFVYCTWKSIRQHYTNHKLKIITPTWNDVFELLDGSYSLTSIPNYIEYIIKIMKHCLLILLFILTSTRLITD